MRARAREIERAEEVRVEGRRLGEGQHVSRERIEREHDAAARSARGDGVAQRGGGFGLERGVEGEAHVAAGRAPALGAARDEQAAARVALDADAPRLAAQPGFFLLLDRAHADAVDVREADHLRGELLVRVDAPRLFEQPHARERERAHALRRLALDPARDEDEGARLAQLAARAPPAACAARRRAGAPSPAGRAARSAMAYTEGASIESASGVPVAIEDRAALGGQRHGVVRLREPAARAALVDGEVRRAGAQHPEEEQQHAARDGDPSCGDPHVRRSHGRGSAAGATGRSITRVGRASP